MSQEIPHAATPAVMARAIGTEGAPAGPADGSLEATSGASHGAVSTEEGVRAALGLLDGLDDLLPADHVGRFEQVHDALRAHLNGDAGR
ncbi:hypothetical protein L1785_11130 [Antribacter sp. KLBMP9083]|uniref:Uncharacterized protein n=1 Tax=Antribacter soli TaxID=2910976 RepID=A0AA41QDN1_9MICO|nr:hypothetical protein [Antribacter soli]MCF4121534.1 hypothetical protein [Antribacter soli]